MKLNRLCNLSCSYCYYINSDTEAPGSKISGDLLFDFFDKYYAYIKASDKPASISFHGGEPLLMGIDFFERAVSHPGFTQGYFVPVVQTNGTKISGAWVDFFKEFKFTVGVSIDGDQENHDRNRKFSGGRGSHAAVMRGIELLEMGSIPFGVISVVNSNSCGRRTYRALREIPTQNLDILMPMFSHESPISLESEISGVKDFMLGFFAEWLKESSKVRVRFFDSMFHRALGYKSEFSGLGAPKENKYVVLETDGFVHHDEELYTVDLRHSDHRAYREHITDLECFKSFEDKVDDWLEKKGAFTYSDSCKSCSLFSVCQSGSLINRYSATNGFNNPSVHCLTMYELASHITRLTSSSPDT